MASSPKSLTLDSLLVSFGFDPSRPTKLVRHRDSRFDVDELYRANQFEFYQSIQSGPVFDSCERIISFVGLPGTHAAFVGVYDVLSVEGPGSHPLPDGFIFPTMKTDGCFRYTLRCDERFSELRGRLVIDWGKGTRSWIQRFRPGEKPVIEIRPSGYVREFPGFMNVVLRHHELVNIVKYPVPHRDWHRMLRSVYGVYLILDTRTGDQYVGSAYGEDGILGRWRAYADSIHGDTAQLRELAASRRDLARDLQFAILQTLPTTLTPQEVLDFEKLHKRKLGTRAHGLNSN